MIRTTFIVRANHSLLAVAALVVLAILLAGCEKHTAVTGGFELISDPNMGPDSHPGVGLGYRGKKVWRNIDAHTFVDVRDTKRFAHDDLFVFLMSIPDNDEDHYQYEISPQLAAIRGAGPPVVLSERILGREMDRDHVVCKFVPSDAGIHVEFGPWPEPDPSKPTAVQDVTWEQISAWVSAAESQGASGAPKIVKPLGTYRVLPPAARPATRP